MSAFFHRFGESHTGTSSSQTQKLCELLGKAADKGDADAQKNLGVMYKSGTGVEKDLVEAVKWFRKAADRGNVSAQFALGLMYANGEGLEPDLTEAVKWYRKAADQGNTFAAAKLRGVSAKVAPEEAVNTGVK